MLWQFTCLEPHRVTQSQLHTLVPVSKTHYSDSSVSLRLFQIHSLALSLLQIHAIALSLKLCSDSIRVTHLRSAPRDLTKMCSNSFSFTMLCSDSRCFPQTHKTFRFHQSDSHSLRLTLSQTGCLATLRLMKIDRDLFEIARMSSS